MSIHLISCDNCGVVLDAEKLNFPLNICGADEEIDPTKAIWIKEVQSYAPVVPCPVCQNPIPEPVS